MKNGEPLWTIDELGAAVASALAEGYGGASERPGAGRARPSDDPLLHDAGLDRPAGRDEGPDGVLWPEAPAPVGGDQEAPGAGQSLAEVQRALAGQTDKVLAQVGRDSEIAAGRRGPNAPRSGPGGTSGVRSRLRMTCRSPRMRRVARMRRTDARSARGDLVPRRSMGSRWSRA